MARGWWQLVVPPVLVAAAVVPFTASAAPGEPGGPRFTAGAPGAGWVTFLR